MLEQRLEWTQAVQDQIDVQQAVDRLEALFGLAGGIIFEVVLQLTAQASVAAL
tara:strand:+ start:204 stop:362 length:159 start_codon:yes stop_codon:yes gene_type:complete